MSNKHFAQFERYLSENPGSTATEIGLTSVEANRLEKSGRIVRVGERQTGKAGRRPIEYALPGQSVKTDNRVLEAQERAKAKVEAHDNYERIASRMWRLREAFPGLLNGDLSLVPVEISDEYLRLADEKAAVRKAYNGKLPPTPTAVEMTLAGVQTVGAPVEATDED